MTAVLNRTARQFNLRHIVDGVHALVRLKPGLNFVDDTAWDIVRQCDFVTQLREKSEIDFDDVDEARDPAQKPPAQQKAQTKVAKVQAKAPDTPTTPESGKPKAAAK